MTLLPASFQNHILSEIINTIHNKPPRKQHSIKNWKTPQKVIVSHFRF